MQYAEARDQHIGRVMAGLPVLYAKYALLLPHFCAHEEISSTIEEHTCSSLEINIIVQCLFPLFYMEYPVP